MLRRCPSLVLGTMISALSLTTDDSLKTTAVTDTRKGTGTRTAVVRSVRRGIDKLNTVLYLLDAQHYDVVRCSAYLSIRDILGTAESKRNSETNKTIRHVFAQVIYKNTTVQVNK